MFLPVSQLKKYINVCHSEYLHRFSVMAKNHHLDKQVISNIYISTLKSKQDTSPSFWRFICFFFAQQTRGYRQSMARRDAAIKRVRDPKGGTNGLLILTHPKFTVVFFSCCPNPDLNAFFFVKILWLVCWKKNRWVGKLHDRECKHKAISDSQIHRCHIHNLRYCDIFFQKSWLEGGQDSGTEVWQDEWGNKWDQMGTKNI